MRELPLSTQVRTIKDNISQLVQIYQDNTFNTDDVRNPYPGQRLSPRFFEGYDFNKVFLYLESIGEIIILNRTGGEIAPYFEFRITEKFNTQPKLTITVPVTTQIVKEFEDALPKMMSAYASLAILENRLRFFIKDKLEEKYGSSWWDYIPKKVKENIEYKKTNGATGWHIQLPKSDIQYTEFTDLIKIIKNQDNWDNIFKPIFHEQNLIETPLTLLEIPRNTIAHSNVLSNDMLEQLERYCKDILNCLR